MSPSYVEAFELELSNINVRVICQSFISGCWISDDAYFLDFMCDFPMVFSVVGFWKTDKTSGKSVCPLFLELSLTLFSMTFLL
jgi:hypothetical protein